MKLVRPVVLPLRILLAFGFAGIVFGTRRLGWLQSIHGVERRSEGGIYYPVAIYLLFLLGGETARSFT